jgi:hypothetical protein
VVDRQFADLAQLWRHFADNDAGPYSPLYAAIARGVADDPVVLAVAREAPPHAHLPIALLAAVHDLLLGGLEHPLAEVYAGRSDADPMPLFRDVCLSQREAILRTLTRRHVQTNECGRSALIALALAEITERFGAPEALVDAGASAGLNLLYDRYHLDYGRLGSLGDAASPVVVACDVRPPRPLPASLPSIPVRVGLDREPLDLDDPEDARWLLACVWPDTGRLDRTRAAIELATQDKPAIRRGDMVHDIRSTVDDAHTDGLVCVLTSWAFAYLSHVDRGRFVQQLDEAAGARPLLWLCLDTPGTVSGVDVPKPLTAFGTEPSVVTVAGFGPVRTEPHVIALVHPHGTTLEWTSAIGRPPDRGQVALRTIQDVLDEDRADE